MRTFLLFMITTLGAVLLIACNSHEGAVLPRLTQSSTPPSQAQQTHNPAENARRITAEELHDMWEKDKVVIVDTRTDAAFKQSHIKGAILIPAGEVASRVGELPKDKFIATYCT